MPEVMISVYLLIMDTDLLFTNRHKDSFNMPLIPAIKRLIFNMLHISNLQSSGHVLRA